MIYLHILQASNYKQQIFELRLRKYYENKQAIGFTLKILTWAELQCFRKGNNVNLPLLCLIN
jgi:hypothetical protein